MILLWVLFAALVNQVNGCECEVIDAETSFANSDFVSRVVVENVTRPEDSILVVITKDGLHEYRHIVNEDAEIVYTVNHLDVYKSPTEGLSTEVRTAHDDGVCGVELSIGKVLVLAGDVKSSYLNIHLCSYNFVDQATAERLRLNTTISS